MHHVQSCIILTLDSCRNLLLSFGILLVRGIVLLFRKPRWKHYRSNLGEINVLLRCKCHRPNTSYSHETTSHDLKHAIGRVKGIATLATDGPQKGHHEILFAGALFQFGNPIMRGFHINISQRTDIFGKLDVIVNGIFVVGHYLFRVRGGGIVGQTFDLVAQMIQNERKIGGVAVDKDGGAANQFGICFGPGDTLGQNFIGRHGGSEGLEFGATDI